jgi:hypothetical protein
MDARHARRWLLPAAASLVGALCLGPRARAGVVPHPALDWKTLHTAHFAIHFHDGGEPAARRVAALAERVHERLTKTFNWRPTDRSDIVITDELDISNGNATPFPANRINMYLAPPDTINSLEANDGWLETLITHEHTHIIHLDKASGYPKALRYVLGRIIDIIPGFNAFPNLWQPTWLIEGLAVYHETDRARHTGRGQSSLFDMMMRMEVEGGFKPVTQVNQQVDTWPGGTTPYLYGSQFYQFIADTRGPEKIQRLVEETSGDVVPFLVNWDSRRTFGKDTYRMWDEFSSTMHNKHQPVLRAIRAAGVHAGERLSQDGYQAGSLKALPDGRAFYVAFDGRNDPALMVYRPGDKEPSKLAEVHYGARLDVHVQAGVLVAQPNLCRNTHYNYDLYRYDADSGSRKRLTHCGRYRHAAWSPDGQRIAAVHYELGSSRIELLAADGTKQELWWSGENGEVVGAIDWAPNGASLVAAVWRRASGWNIEQFLIGERRWRALTTDAAIDGEPRFSHDGSAVLFTSDHGGVYNVRRYDLATGAITTLTNVLGGAFFPTDGGASLYYIGYGPQGYDLYRVADAKASPTPKAAPGASVVVEADPPAVTDARITGYDPDTGVRPRWWFPYVAADDQRTEVGAMTASWDPLFRHIYAATVAYDFKNHSPVGALGYIYDGWYPTLKLHASRSDNLTYADTDDDGNEDDFVRMRHEDKYRAEMVLPLLGYRRQFAFHLGALRDDESDVRRADGIAPKADTRDSLLGIAFTLDSTRDYPLSVSRSHGREIRLVGEDSDVFQSDFTGRTYSLDWRELISLGREHVLGLRLVEGYATAGARPFRLGGSQTDDAWPGILDFALTSPFNHRDFPLRGYPDGRADLTDARLRLTTLEYRFPLWRLERGWMGFLGWLPPAIALHQLSGTVFVDSGGVWHDGNQPDHYRTGAGVELVTDMALFYFLRFNLRFGYARGYNEGGEHQFYLRIGSSF